MKPMKKVVLCVLLGGIVSGLLAGCSSIPWTSGSYWDETRSNQHKKQEDHRQEIRIALGAVRVDKALGASSVRDEISRLAAMLVLEYGYQVAGEGEEARYRLELEAVEREFLQGWQNRRSVAVEAWLFDNPGAEEVSPADTGQAGKPRAIGKALSVGNKTLASSRDLEHLLRKALGPVLSRDLEP